MTPFVSLVVRILSVLTIAGQVVVVFWVAVGVGSELKSNWSRRVADLFGRNANLFALIVATVATAGSLFLSEVGHLEPCRLCWFQRIFMYPQVVLFAVAWWKRSRAITVSALVLTLIGAAFAAYHVYLQEFGPTVTTCVAGGDIPCYLKQFTQFGYVTIPIMALTAFAIIFSLLLLQRAYWCRQAAVPVVVPEWPAEK